MFKTFISFLFAPQNKWGLYIRNRIIYFWIRIKKFELLDYCNIAIIFKTSLGWNLFQKVYLLCCPTFCSQSKFESKGNLFGLLKKALIITKIVDFSSYLFLFIMEFVAKKFYCVCTTHSAYVAMSTKSDGVKIDEFLHPNFM